MNSEKMTVLTAGEFFVLAKSYVWDVKTIDEIGRNETVSMYEGILVWK
jgi:hypothetical protein